MICKISTNCVGYCRILYFTTCASAFLVFAYYTSVLTSWMTAKEPAAKIRVNM